MLLAGRVALVSMTFIPLLGYYLLARRRRRRSHDRSSAARGASPALLPRGRVCDRASLDRLRRLARCLPRPAGSSSRSSKRVLPRRLQYLSYVDVWLRMRGARRDQCGPAGRGGDSGGGSASRRGAPDNGKRSLRVAHDVRGRRRSAVLVLGRPSYSSSTTPRFSWRSRTRTSPRASWVTCSGR